MNKNAACILLIASVATAACKTQSKHEKAFTDKLTALYESQTTTVSTDRVTDQKGTSYQFTINIKGAAYDPTALAAVNDVSYPAYAFFRDTLSKMEDYGYVNVTVESEGIIKTKKYQMKDLEEVERCKVFADRFIQGIMQKNNDSLAFYIDPAVMSSTTIPSLLEKLDTLDKKHGQITGSHFDGFSIVNAGSHSMINFNMRLTRVNAEQYIQINIRPVTEKVYDWKLSPAL